MLHTSDAYETHIKPHEKDILANDYVKGTHRRYISKLANDVLGMNTEKNKGIAELAHHFSRAAEEENHLNQDPSTAMGKLTSNIGKTIQGVIEAGKA